MSFSINIQGAVAATDAEAHKIIHAIAEVVAQCIHKIEGVKVESASVSTPTASADVTPPAVVVQAQPPADPAGGGEVAVDGDAVATGTHIHPNTPGSPPKGPK